MLEEDPGPIVQRLVLGERLRARREASGIGLDAANDRLKWYRGKLSKIENGTLGLTEKELSALLTLYGVTGPDAAQIIQLGIDARRRAAPERVSDWAKQYVPLERAASEIRMVYSTIPGFLQTKGHAKAELSRSPVVLATDIESMAAARQERGDRLFRENAPRVWVVLGEEALYRIDTAERAGQLARLRKIAELPNVTIRLVPMEAGPQAGLSCPFTLLWIEGANATIAYVETLTGADYVKTTSAYTLAYEKAESVALTRDETLDRLDRVASGHDR
ncbi:helix-turn-helix domain-containing protein [Amycolatopsis orientalis]|uniref:helix-turn-helix domain-containing protein n=1 Tax=Amycolatopsis orientalis TaxID=31958 RepID=UPI0003A90D00|nr:helix-turn-helix transcriptional regulator [Amycolatopsis orientalis]